MNIYSRIEPTTLLHIINRKGDIMAGRTDLVSADEFIQCAAMKQKQGMTFKPHRHIEQPRYESAYIPQESWVVISGLVKVILYDLDNTILHEDILEPGDCSITLRAGHNYLFLQGSVVFEYKTGPYYGQDNDKIFI